MSGLSSCNSWKDLKKPQNPFFGAMFSRSHRKRKRKRVLKPIDNPSDRGRSLEPCKKVLESTGLRSISLENNTVNKITQELDEKLVLSTKSSLEIKRPPRPNKPNDSKKLLQDSSKKSLQSLDDRPSDSSLDKYSFIDEALLNNTISMRKKFVKPSHPEVPKPMKSFRPVRKYIKSPKKLDFLPFAPDLKPVSLNSFQLSITRSELEFGNFWDLTEREGTCRIDDLLNRINCKLCL
jgi:hypothetical protein